MAEGDHTILSLDLGSTMGWALVKNTIIVQSGAVSLKHKDAHPGDRFLRFKQILDKFPNVNEICYEDISFQTSRDQSRLYDGLLAFLQVHCLVHKIRLIGINNTTIKKIFTGNHHAKKDEMCAVAHRMGWKHGEPGTDLDHDECDAIACAVVRLKRQNISCSFK